MELLMGLVGSAESGMTFIADVLRDGTRLWLVPAWYESLDGRWRKPVRLIRVDTLEHQMPGPAGFEVLIAHSIPKAVLDGLSQSAEGIAYEVQEAPEVLIPTSARH